MDINLTERNWRIAANIVIRELETKLETVNRDLEKAVKNEPNRVTSLVMVLEHEQNMLECAIMNLKAILA